jgi:hypothetical protein
LDFPFFALAFFVAGAGEINSGSMLTGVLDLIEVGVFFFIFLRVKRELVNLRQGEATTPTLLTPN